MNRKAKLYHAFARTLSLGVLSVGLTGCATMKSPLTWFSSERQVAERETSLAVQDVTEKSKGISGQIKSMGTAVSSAFQKTTNAVKSTFTTDEVDTSDPTSLSNMPSNLGPEIWVTNGQLYESKGNFAKALDNYTKALELEPTNQAALLSTARLYGRQGQNQQAVDFFKKSLATAPDAPTYNELALAYKEMGNVAEAQSAIQTAISLDPDNLRYRNNLAGMLVNVGRSDEAVQQLQQVFPPAVANYNVAFLNYSNKNVAAAQQHLQVALQNDPNLSEARQLAEQLGSSPTAQTALAAYNTAQNIYKTAEAVTSPTVPANTAIYQQSKAPQFPTAGHQYPPAGQQNLPAGQPFPAHGATGAANPTGVVNPNGALSPNGANNLYTPGMNQHPASR